MYPSIPLEHIFLGIGALLRGYKDKIPDSWNCSLAAKMQNTSREQRKQAETVNKICPRQGQGRLNLGGQWERCECFHPIGGLTSRCHRTEEPKPATCFSHFHQCQHSSLVSLDRDYCFSGQSFSLWKKKKDTWSPFKSLKTGKVFNQSHT